MKMYLQAVSNYFRVYIRAHLQQKILLQVAIKREIESSDREHQRLQRSKAQRNRSIEKEIVVVAGIVERLRRSQLDQLARRRAQELARKRAPSKVPDLGQVDGRTQVTLEQPNNPEGRHVAQRKHNMGVGIGFDNSIPRALVVLPRLLHDVGRELPRGGEEGKHDEVVEDEERVELVGDVALTRRLGEVAGSDGEAAEDHRQIEVEQGGDGGRQHTLHDGPRLGVSRKLRLESRPHPAQVRQVGQEDGNQGVWGDPDNGKYCDPDVVPYGLRTAFLRGQRQILPDNIIWSRCKADRSTVRMLLTRCVGYTVGVLNCLVAGKAVRHGVPLVHGLADFLYLDFQLFDTLSKVVNGVDFRSGSARFVLLRDLAGGALRR